jgi:hypothetical protein
VSSDFRDYEYSDTFTSTSTPVIESTTTMSTTTTTLKATTKLTSTSKKTTSAKQLVSTLAPKNDTTQTKTTTRLTKTSNTTNISKLTSSNSPTLMPGIVSKTNQTTLKQKNLTSTLHTTLSTANLTSSNKIIKSINVTQSQRPKNLTTTTTTIVDISTECPKNFENYCQNSGECFMKSFASEYVEIVDSNHTIVHSKILNCRCKHFYKYYGLIVVSYQGDRCETQTNSFTYLSMSLIAVSILLLIIFVILVCVLILISKRKNPDYPSFSIEYHNKLYRPRKTLSSRNKMSDTDWMQKFRTIRNSWKYINIKMNRSKGRSSGKKKKSASHFRKNGEETELQTISNKNNSSHRSLKRFLPKKTSNLLQNSAATLSTASLIGQSSSSRSEEIDGSSENFLFSNKMHEAQHISGISLPPTYNSSAPLNTNSLDTKVPANLNVYPKPSRLSNENRFSSNKQEENNPGTLLY